MKLTVFQSDKGDCLLLTSADERRVLIDGGMRDSYSEHVAPALAKLAKAGENLDLVYVSHIDQDHISGVLQLMEDLVDWRIHDYQLASGNKDHPEPTSLRPPEIDEVWHNAFHEQIGGNAGAIEEMLAATATVLGGGTRPRELEEAASRRQLATSVGESIELTRRIGAEQLDIPVNQPFDHRFAMVREKPQKLQRGKLTIQVIGPREQDLADLRDEWNDWLRKNQKALKEIEEEMRADVEGLATGEVAVFRQAIELQAKELGNRSKVTVPNLASLMLFVREGERQVILTGDGHADDIVAGLEQIGGLHLGAGIHVDVLKVQHHCSEHNIHAEFCRRVTADNYVFCGNGAHENPDLDALQAILASRLGDSSDRSPNPEAAGKFKFWFNSSSQATPEAKNKLHMGKVEDLIEGAAKESGRRMTYRFLDTHSFELRL